MDLLRYVEIDSPKGREAIPLGDAFPKEPLVGGRHSLRPATVGLVQNDATEVF